MIKILNRITKRVLIKMTDEAVLQKPKINASIIDFLLHFTYLGAFSTNSSVQSTPSFF